MKCDQRRIRTLRGGEHTGEAVCYVMGRDFRADDNWALLYAQELAKKHRVPLCVLVHIGKNIIETNDRQHSFFIDGLEEVSRTLEEHGIAFFITYGDWRNEVKKFIAIHKIGTIVTDFSPLHEMRWWWDEVADDINLPIYEVDTHNIVPCWVASDKEEFAAHTIRKKLRLQYADFKGSIPKLQKHPHAWGNGVSACWPRATNLQGCAEIDWAGIRSFPKFKKNVSPITWCNAGPKAAKETLQRFIAGRLRGYAERRNDPNADALSDLSPYIRFGFISTQRIAHEIEKVRRDDEDKRVFLEELIVRRELAENFCFYQKNYDNFLGLREWARTTLTKHKKDKREYTYSLEQFESAKTHDLLWNAAQTELLERGKMHGYMRMYWAKKILEWTKTPEAAIDIAIYLNDTYSIDGRDPNGYVGVLWSIGGIHDRPWFERPIFGQIRYMNYNGCKRKFDVERYIKQWIHVNT